MKIGFMNDEMIKLWWFVQMNVMYLDDYRK